MEGQLINLAAIHKTAMKVLTSPAAFFREMPKTGGFVEPLIFLVIMAIISGLIQTVFSIIGLYGMGGTASFILFPILAAIFGFVSAAIFFLIWTLMGSKESYETAYRCIAYTGVVMPITTILGIIPRIGQAAGIALSFYFLIIATIEAHKIASQKAWLVFGIIGGVLILIALF